MFLMRFIDGWPVGTQANPAAGGSTCRVLRWGKLRHRFLVTMPVGAAPNFFFLHMLVSHDSSWTSTPRPLTFNGRGTSRSRCDQPR